MFTLILLVLTTFVAAILLYMQLPRRANTANRVITQHDDGIIPLWDFDFRKVEPAKPLPFLSMGHVTMGKYVPGSSSLNV